MSGKYTVHSVVEPVDPHLIQFYDSNGDLIVTIAPDGTVTIHQVGGDEEAARIFWTQLQLSGQTFLQRISELEYACEILREEHKQSYQRGFEEGRQYERNLRSKSETVEDDERSTEEGAE